MMSNFGDRLIDLARVKQAELLFEAEQERLARKVVHSSRQIRQHPTWYMPWLDGLGKWMVWQGFRFLRPGATLWGVIIIWTRASK